MSTLGYLRLCFANYVHSSLFSSYKVLPALISLFLLVTFSLKATPAQTSSELIAKHDLEYRLEESNRQLIRLRAQAQANEVLARQTLRDTSQKSTQTAQAIINQNAINAYVAQQNAINEGIKTAMLDKQLQEVKEESHKNVIEIISVQVTSVILAIIGYVYNSWKDKRNHKWLVEAQEAQVIALEEHKEEINHQLHEISALLNHEKAPSKRWLDSELGT